MNCPHGAATTTLLKLDIDHGFAFLDLALQQMIGHPLCH